MPVRDSEKKVEKKLEEIASVEKPDSDLQQLPSFNTVIKPGDTLGLNGDDVISTIKVPENSSKEVDSLKITDSTAFTGMKENKNNLMSSGGISFDDGEEITRKGKKKVYAVGVIITLVILGAMGGAFYLRIRNTKENLNDLPTTFSNENGDESRGKQSSEEVDKNDEEGVGLVVTEATGLKRSEISLEILNGTDTTGLAGSTADKFEQLGYQIVKIGNAEEDASENLLYVDPDLEGEVNILLDDVKNELSISSVSGKLSGSEASARIILGE